MPRWPSGGPFPPTCLDLRGPTPASQGFPTPPGAPQRWPGWKSASRGVSATSAPAPGNPPILTWRCRWPLPLASPDVAAAAAAAPRCSQLPGGARSRQRLQAPSRGKQRREALGEPRWRPGAPGGRRWEGWCPREAGGPRPVAWGAAAGAGRSVVAAEAST